MRNSDIRLLFGIQCRKEKLDVAQNEKASSDFIQRLCPNIGHISLKVIKDLLVVAMGRKTERDEEVITKLVYLYVCTKLFFANTGESIGWAYVSVIGRLETLHLYDWNGAIRSALIGSLNELHSRPERVTSYTVVLLVH